MKKDLIIFGQNETCSFIANKLLSDGYKIITANKINDLPQAINPFQMAFLDLTNIQISKEENEALFKHNTEIVPELIEYVTKSKIPFYFFYNSDSILDDKSSTDLAIQLIKKARKYKDFKYSLVETSDIYGQDILTSNVFQTYLEDIIHGTTLYIQDDLRPVNLINQQDLLIGIKKILEETPEKTSYTLINEENLTQIEFTHFLDDLTDLELVIEYEENNEDLSNITTDTEVSYPEGWTPSITLEEGVIEMYKSKGIPVKGDDVEETEEKKEEEILLAQETLQKRSAMQSFDEEKDEPVEIEFETIEDDYIDKDDFSDEEEMLYKESHRYNDDEDIYSGKQISSIFVKNSVKEPEDYADDDHSTSYDSKNGTIKPSYGETRSNLFPSSGSVIGADPHSQATSTSTTSSGLSTSSTSTSGLKIISSKELTNDEVVDKTIKTSPLNNSEQVAKPADSPNTHSNSPIIKETLGYLPSKPKSDASSLPNPYLQVPPAKAKIHKSKKKAIVALSTLLLLIMLTPTILYSYNLTTGLNDLKNGTQALKEMNFASAQISNTKSLNKLNNLDKLPLPIKLVAKTQGVDESEINQTLILAKKASEAQMALISDIGSITLQDQNQETVNTSNILGAFSSNQNIDSIEKAVEISAIIDSMKKQKTYTQSPILSGIFNSFQNFPDTQSLFKINNLILATPTLLGNNQPQKYLVLIQNPNQLMATGGKVELYALVQVDKGNFKILNKGPISDLNSKLEENFRENPPPPLPIRKALDEKVTNFSNINWAPELTKNAKNMIQLYEQIEDNDISGIIFINPEYFNVIEELTQNENISTNLKEIYNGFNSKKISMYNKDSQVQKYFILNGWAGEQDYSGDDFLYVIDSNLSGKDMDSDIERSISYSATQPSTGKDFTRSTSITYKNNSKIADNTYINHVRVYVPKNAYLNDAKLVTPEEEKNIIRKVEIYPDGNKLVFATDISIDPGQSIALVLDYDSPSTFIGSDEVKLHFVKQPNIENHPINVKFTYSKDVPDREKINEMYSIGNNEISINDTLNEDKTYKIPL